MPSKIVDNAEAVDAGVVGAAPQTMKTHTRFSPVTGLEALIQAEDLRPDFRSPHIEEKSFSLRPRLLDRAPRQKALPLLFERLDETKKNQWKHNFRPASAGGIRIRGIAGNRMNVSLVKRGRRDEGSA